jgi:hypothetical protein
MTILTHAIAPARYKRYLETGDTYGLGPDDIATCDRCFPYETVGDLFLVEPAPRAMHTRNDPPLAFYTFVKAETHISGEGYQLLTAVT